MIEMIKRAISTAKNFEKRSSDGYGSGWSYNRIWSDRFHPVLIYTKSGQKLECYHYDIKELSSELIEVYDRNMGHRSFLAPNNIEMITVQDYSDKEKLCQVR